MTGDEVRQVFEAMLPQEESDRLRACETHGGRFVIRLQENGKPKVDSIARGQVTQECFPGTALDALLTQETRVLDGRVIDADGPVGRGSQALPLRLVGVQSPQGSCFFLTNLPPRIGPRQLADSCQSMAQAVERKGAEATQRWNKIAELRTQSGRAPHCRRRPSVLDPLRGWNRQPIARKTPNSGDVPHGHVKAAA